MKTKVEETERVGFKPVSLTITIENEMDMAWLIAISNTNHPKAIANCNEFDSFPKAAEIIEKVTVDGYSYGKSQMDFYYAVMEAKEKTGF